MCMHRAQRRSRGSRSHSATTRSRRSNATSDPNSISAMLPATGTESVCRKAPGLLGPAVGETLYGFP
jgi:hypothetical protein